MAILILIAEAAAVLWFAAYFGLLATLYQSPKKVASAKPDPVGLSFISHARRAQFLGHGLLALYIGAASLNLAFGLGLDLPL